MRNGAASGFADRIQIRIQLRAKFIDDRLQLVNLVGFQKLPVPGPTQPVFAFVERSSGHSYEAPIIRESPSAAPFCDVGSHAVSGPYELKPRRSPIKFRPLAGNRPDGIGQALRKPVNLQRFELRPGHTLSALQESVFSH
ncbi:MAG TPA: hypothetical protein VL132_13070 [Planctomycetaceae bacterium]|nr:hypothetical protein SH412_005224 [Planctomycetaceae bacterium SH412]HTN02809.1 hypothetical protein [Planctomycetaceae bacterium]